MRTKAEIQVDIDRNNVQFDETRKYFGAMWSCDVQASMFRQSSNAHLDALRAELAAVKKEVGA